MSTPTQIKTSDFYVAPLPRSTIEKCRDMYDLYIEQIQNEGTTTNANANNTSPTTATKTTEMLPSTLAKLLEDLGVPTTENDARSLIFSLSQNAAMQISQDESVQRHRVAMQQQAQLHAKSLEQQSPSGGKSNNNPKRGRASSVDQKSNSRRSSVSQQNNNGPNNAGNQQGNYNNNNNRQLELPQSSSASNKLSLSFEMFLRVLQMPFNKAMRELEMQQLWTELDRDGDGVLSSSDIAQSIERMNAMTSKGIPRVAAAENNDPSSPFSRQKQQQQQDHDDNVSPTDENNRKSSPVVEKHDDPNTSSRSKATQQQNNKNNNNNKTALSKTLARIQQTQTSTTSTNTQANETAATAASAQQQQQSSSLDQEALSLFHSPWMLETLTEHQLEALLHQLDADGDGNVTFTDLKESLMNA